MRSKHLSVFFLAAAAALCLTACGEAASDAGAGEADAGRPDTAIGPDVNGHPADPRGTSEEKWRFSSHFQPVSYEVAPAIQPYLLPLHEDQVPDLHDLVPRLGLDEALLSLLENGFVVRPYGQVEDISEVYRNLEEADIPIFVTTDTWLHLYHVQFDEILKELEETIFYGDILAITDRLYRSAEELHASSDGLLGEAARRNMAFFRVARELLAVSDDPSTAPESPAAAAVAGEVSAELELIEAHEGFGDSPLFKYKEDYSQYVPRGHYTRSEKLKSYFRTCGYSIGAVPALLFPIPAVFLAQGIVTTRAAFRCTGNAIVGAALNTPSP